MGYIAPTWQNGGPPALNAKNMQDISDNLEYVSNNMVNPNLLDNWYFGNPVNQRGQTSWVVTDTYTIDRWKIEGYIVGEDKGVTLNNNSVTIFDNITSEGYIGIFEMLENNLARNTEITISVLTATGLCVFSTTVPEADATVRAKDFQNFTLYFYILSGHQSVTLRCKAGQSESFYAVKLELGSQQTLAHQEDGVWVLNEIPDYGEQLRRCQRYCRVYPANKAMPCIAYLETDGWYLDAALWVGDMRTAPANNLGDGIACKVQYIDGGNTYAETATNWGLLSSSMQVLRLAGTQIPSDKRAFPYVVVPQVDLVFSADL